MNLVSEIWTWTEGGRLYSRLTTNAPARIFLPKLAAVGLHDCAETIQAYFDDRAHSGNGYEILWKQQTQISNLKNLIRL